MSESSPSLEETMALHVMRRQCGIAYRKHGTWYVGTGSVVELGGGKYILTCKHVADSFFNSERTQVLFEQGGELSKEDLEYVSYVDDPIDQAALGVPSSFDIEHSFEESDFDAVSDFSNYDFRGNGLFVYGYPIERVERTEEGFLFPRFGFLTELDEYSESRLVLSYLKGTDQVVTKSGLDIPDPGGMSGGLILTVPNFESDKIWTPTNARALAMQYAWNTKDCLYASSLQHILDSL